ncbi:MAG: hypothetical protein RIC87_09700 [Kiloniellales bacterium]
MRALKAVVIIMGILIVAGFAFVIVTIVSRVDGDAPSEAVGQITLDSDPSCRLADAWSGDGILYIRLAGPDRQTCETILQIDPKTGKEIGRISLGPSSSAVE